MAFAKQTKYQKSTTTVRVPGTRTRTRTCRNLVMSKNNCLYLVFALSVVANIYTQLPVLRSALSAETPSEVVPVVAETLPSERVEAPPENKAPPRKYPPPDLLHENYGTLAVQEEARRHDRLIVESVAYFGSMTASDVAEMNAVGRKHTNASDLCITIFSANREMPYLHALLMALFTGQKLERLLSFAQFNILNTEHRPERAEFPRMRDLARFEFVNFYNASELHPLPADTNFNVHFRRDTITALDICIESKLPYCLVLEDDAVTSTGFIDNLERFVIQPLKNHEIQAAFVQLFAHTSNPWTSAHVQNEEYVSSGQFEADRSKTNRERRSKGLAPYTPHFEIKEMAWEFGTVGNLYSLDTARRLRGFLDAYGTDAWPEPADYLMSKGFLDILGLRKAKVEPSLVNHIGFYSEREKEIKISHTDVQFLYDPGKW
uniref:Uncharacterized protein n=1 Tax=Pseudo-nitzschia australis TaxID=44445 RepID=A0A7S4EPU4_9STRA|mmetsp:Transcript_17279/g.36126  ORF Transcript_17279/g.36126 Transcript_17279/m.36126 type:complete len:433 (+) Transcript_17279:223-1521(+)